MSGAARAAADPLDAAAALSHARLLYSARAVDRAIARMGKEITAAIGTANPVLLANMHGGVFTAGALAAHCNFPYEFDYVHVTRYANGLAGGDLEWRVRPSARLAGRTVLIVDDILDRGLTLTALQDELSLIGVTRQLAAVLVVKRLDEHAVRPAVDFMGFDVDDVYVFGCGMDYKGYWRGLRSLYALHERD